MKGKRILITGSAGSIGAELVRQLAPSNHIYCLDQNESGLADLMEELKVAGRVGDIRDEITIRDVFSDFKPQIVFHAAAYKCVNMMEVFPLEAIQTNIMGTHILVSTAKRWECVTKFINISSDKAVNSFSVMGQSKRMAESLVRNAGKNFVSVRFGNVMDSNGSLLRIWQRQHAKGLPLSITDVRMERYFMSIPEAVKLVLKAAKFESGLVIMNMGDKKKVIDLKKELYGDYPHKFIGIRPGETLSETLMTDEEKRRAVKNGEFYIIP